MDASKCYVLLGKLIPRGIPSEKLPLSIG